MVDKRTIARIAKEFHSVVKLLNERRAAALGCRPGQVDRKCQHRFADHANPTVAYSPWNERAALPASEREIGKGRVRRCGAGPASVVRNPKVIRSVERFIEPRRAGHSPIRWTRLSCEEIASRVRKAKPRSIATMLHELRFQVAKSTFGRLAVPPISSESLNWPISMFSRRNS